MARDLIKKKRWLWVLLYIAPWTLMALLASAGSYIAEGSLDHPIPLGPLLRQEFKCWYASAFISVGVIWLCRRNRLEPGRVGRWVAWHSAGAIALSALYAVVTSWLVAGEKSVMHPGKILAFGYLIKSMGLHYCLLNVMIYWLVVFGQLGWDYYGRYRERELEAAELQRELVEARLEALRMQLNPHFLFNTLHAISAMIHENPETADRMIARLSELLRLTLDGSKAQEVPLSQELEFLDRYLEIEQARFSDRLKIEKLVQPEVLTALVPYLILQPLVENAIRHGIEPREELGQISIRASHNNGMLQLCVSDNGPGLCENEPAAWREGIGLSNTRSRLRHLHGENGRLELASAPGGGLEARIELPFRTANQADLKA